MQTRAKAALPLTVAFLLLAPLGGCDDGGVQDVGDQDTLTGGLSRYDDDCSRDDDCAHSVCVEVDGGSYCAPLCRNEEGQTSCPPDAPGSCESVQSHDAPACLPGCSGESGSCPRELECGDGGRCVPPSDCQPDCSDKDCGSDGCGGSCGSCAVGMECAQGSCVSGG